MNGFNDYPAEALAAHSHAEREFFRLITNTKTRRERMVVSDEFRKELWGDERAFMLSMDALNKQALASLKKANLPITQKNLNRAVMGLRRVMMFVFEKKRKPHAA